MRKGFYWLFLTKKSGSSIVGIKLPRNLKIKHNYRGIDTTN